MGEVVFQENLPKEVKLPLTDKDIEYIFDDLPKVWDYEKSVKKVTDLRLKRKTVTVQILRELYVARRILNSQGKRNDLFPNGKKLGWVDYLIEVGLAYSTVNRWLKDYDYNKNEIRRPLIGEPPLDNSKYQGIGAGYSGEDENSKVNLAYIAGIELKCPNCGNVDYSRTFEGAVNEAVQTELKRLTKENKKS